MRKKFGRSASDRAQAPINEAKCKAPAGTIRPVVDAQRCEGKAACVAVCPYNVFEIGRLADDVFSAMPLRVKFKLWAHGKKTAYTPNADACRACGWCVSACPEKAIKLVRHEHDRAGMAGSLSSAT